METYIFKIMCTILEKHTEGQKNVSKYFTEMWVIFSGSMK
jgi:hypothetical protein